MKRETWAAIGAGTVAALAGAGGAWAARAVRRRGRERAATAGAATGVAKLLIPSLPDAAISENTVRTAMRRTQALFGMLGRVAAFTLWERSRPLPLNPGRFSSRVILPFWPPDPNTIVRLPDDVGQDYGHRFAIYPGTLGGDVGDNWIRPDMPMLRRQMMGHICDWLGRIYLGSYYVGPSEALERAQQEAETSSDLYLRNARRYDGFRSLTPYRVLEQDGVDRYVTVGQGHVQFGGQVRSLHTEYVRIDAGMTPADRPDWRVRTTAGVFTKPQVYYDYWMWRRYVELIAPYFAATLRATSCGAEGGAGARDDWGELADRVADPVATGLQAAMGFYAVGEMQTRLADTAESLWRLYTNVPSCDPPAPVVGFLGQEGTRLNRFLTFAVRLIASAALSPGGPISALDTLREISAGVTSQGIRVVADGILAEIGNQARAALANAVRAGIAALARNPDQVLAEALEIAIGGDRLVVSESGITALAVGDVAVVLDDLSDHIVVATPSGAATVSL